MDIKVEIRPSGFEQLWVVKTQAGLDQLVSEQAGGDQGVATAMTADGLVATPQSDGGVIFTAEDTKKIVAKLAPPMVWDAATDTAGNPTAGASADFDVVDNGDPLPPKTGATGDLELSVVPDQEWLSDPERQFPITIDPTYVTGTQQGPIFDTWVKEGETVDRSASTLMPAGMGSDGLKHRSFLTFSTTPFQGKTITSASLSLWGNDVGSCTASAWSAYDAGLSSTSTRWTAQPTIGTKYGTSTQTKGGTSCPDGLVNIDMKAQVQSWADGTATTKGMALKADNETTYASYHRFSASEAASNQPVLRWSYNRVPGTMATPTVGPMTSYKPAGSSVSYLYTSSLRPKMTGIIPADPDGDIMAAKFYAYSDATSTGATASINYCSTAFLAGGSTATCDMRIDLPTNTTVWMRARAQDTTDNGGYSAAREVRIASVVPTVPVITCPGLSNNTWTTTGPSANVTCTITATGTGYSAPSAIKWSVDGSASTTTPITQSSSTATAKTTVTLSNMTGGHKITAQASNPAGLTSTQGLFQTGWGTASLTLPKMVPQVTTTDTVAVEAAGPPKGGSALPTAKVQWRVAGATGTNGWKDAPAGTTFAVTDAAGGTKATTLFDTTSLVGESDASSIAVGERTTTLLDLRACLTYDSGTQCTTETTVQRVPHAYGSGFPEADAGPGKVGLWTGELSVSDSDADLTTPDGSLSVSRTHNSFAGPAVGVQNRVFGPGWTASFDGDDSGAGGSEIWDNTYADGSISVVDSDGEMLTFLTPGSTPGTRRTTAVVPAGTYVPADDDTAEAGVLLTVTGTQTSTVLELKGDDGIVTKFQVVTSPPVNDAAVFRTVEIREPATNTKTTYSYDTDGRVVAIIAALPDGVTSCVPAASGAGTNGCRVLKITYAAVTTATSSTPGDFADQVKQVTAQVNTDTDKALATYKYNLSGQLVSVTDVRPNLTTAYTYTGTGTSLRLATLTPPAQAAFTFVYTFNKLFKVTRPNPTTAGGGTAQLGAYLYAVPLTGTVTGLSNMATEVAQWNQDRNPTWAAAVFGQDKPITAAPVANSPDWQSADLQFTDDQGYTLNTAAYGAGDWQLTANDYDAKGNVIRSWDERATAGIRDGSIAGGAAASDAATLTVYNDDITSGTTVLTPAGTLITDTYGPVHDVAADDGTIKPLRTHTTTSYDQNAPTPGINPDTTQPYRLPTTVTTVAETADGIPDKKPDGTAAPPLSRSFMGYGAVVTGDTSGWALGQATTSTIDMDNSATVNTGDITSKTRYDAKGRVIENRQPKSTGTDAGTRVTAYYTAAATGTTGCTSKPQWAGLVCKIGPAAQPSGQTMPISTTTGFTWDLQSTTQVETSGSVTSTTTTAYDAQDRPTTVTTSVTGLTGSQSVPALTTTYDVTTGNVTATTSTAGTTGMTYDNWGRQLTYTNTPAGQTADSSTTTYDTGGRVTTVVDNNGQTSYVYDGTDAAGQAERRGLTTAVKVKITGGTEYTSTGSYDQSGNLTLEKLPGNLIRRTSIDIAGDQTSLTVNGQGLNPDTGNLEPDQPWLGWSTTSNAKTQIVGEYTPDGGALADAGETNRTYTYDQAQRLTKVQDATGTPGINGGASCETRTYGFDSNGNRTNQNAYQAATDSTCTTSTTGTPITRAYDTADRPTTGANGTGTYTYDQLGRQTLIPATDAPNTADGNLTLAYYDTDNIRTITQNSTTTSYTLDGAQRRLTQTKTSGAAIRTLTRHYTDAGDNPTWTADTAAGATTTTRYNELINGDLGLTLSTDGATTTAQLDLATPRGDTATTVTLPTGAIGPSATPAVSVDAWASYTEYGTPKQDTSGGAGGITGIGYGWLGSKQRATLGGGLTLMGARLYNRASGSFTSTDPVFGGNDTTYAYPGDPINESDLDGTNRQLQRKADGGGGGRGGFRSAYSRGGSPPVSAKSLPYKGNTAKGAVNRKMMYADQYNRSKSYRLKRGPSVNRNYNINYQTKQQARKAAHREANRPSRNKNVFKTYRRAGGCGHYHCDYTNRSGSIRYYTGHYSW